ncbi:hypothetical protein ABEB36_005979 [Hypothenemus hampei]|uniref:UDP-glucuronosyltransferase n=1 Tax=Hypothenemus hampei TaxID=57062 RepID=A0ABD1F3W3_HYPHA
MLNISLKLVIFSLFIIFSNGAKILFLSCTPAPSHQKPFQVIWKALSLRGHEVHVLTPNPLNDSKLTNLTEYDLSDFYELIQNVNPESHKYLMHKPSFFSAFVKDIYATSLFSKIYNRTINHPETRRLIETNQHFDVIIVEWLFPTLASLGAYYKAPIVGITSLGAPLVALDTLGNPTHPVLAPEMNLPLRRDLSFTERLLSVLYSIYVRIYYHLVVLPREDANIKKHISADLPYLGDIEKNISVLLMNRNPVFHRMMPLFPNIVDLGGIHITSVKKPLDPKVITLLENSKNGVIYFSLGSSMKSVLLSNETIKVLQNAFKSLPYDVIWKWENENMENKPDNVFISQWLPQETLLAHPKVKLFITQGGLQSIEEAITVHKPIIGIPFHSDQTTNVDSCVKYGLGKMINLEELDENILKSYAIEIINDPKYAENAKKLNQLMKDQPQDGLEKAIWWIEYVSRHKGARHLRSLAVDLPWWQYLLLDVLGFLFGIFIAFILIVYLVFKLLVITFKKLRSINKNKIKLS